MNKGSVFHNLWCSYDMSTDIGTFFVVLPGEDEFEVFRKKYKKDNCILFWVGQEEKLPDAKCEQIDMFKE